jgi:uroporphyrinogen-III decarboxylase
MGDMKIEDLAEFAGNSKSILWGGIPGAYFTANVDEAEFERHVKHLLSIMRKEPRYVLGVADQVPPDGLEERVKRVGELVKQYGKYERA